MQHIKTPARRPWRERATAFLLALFLVLGLTPGFRGMTDTALAHWADTYLDEMVEWGFIRSDQAEHPDEHMTRADFMAIINRAYGYTKTGPTPFEDVDPEAWYYDDVGIAYNANYIRGTGPTTVSPEEPLTRETSATILGRNMMVQESEGEIMDFSDARDISAWARGTIKSSLEHYLVDGYDDGTFKPQNDLTWGEMAAMVTRIVGMPIQEAGDYTLGGVFGNVTISSDGVTLRDSIISGDLYVTGGVGLGGVKLENVTVLGRIIASGSGESQSGAASIVLRNVVADQLLVDNLQNDYVTVRVDGVTEIGQTTVRTGAYLEDNSPEGLGLKNITLAGEDGTRLDLAGRIENVTIKTPNAQVQVAKGTVASLTVDEEAPDTNITINRGAEVKELNLDIGTYVSGDGDIKKLNVNAEGCIVTIQPEQIYIRPGITAVINNQIMDSTSAEEASRDPMILSGYPLANDLAPTSFQAVFATNKKGTVYWAVSPITDGSVATEDLISAPAYGGIATLRGSVAIPGADEMVGVTVGTPKSTTGTNNRPNNNNNNNNTGLIPGGSYYLAAVLVDDRGEQSPTKVIAFTTPDDSTPAFAEGYPYFSQITNIMAQVAVMPTKTCKLYYALLPAGAVAPTENELRTNSVKGKLGYGVRDVVKNTEDVFQVNDLTLEEQVSYDLYLWLVDANGANKSAITKLSFTTVDKTPPEFLMDPEPDDIKATSVNFSFRLNEAGTVYWTVVETGADYPKPEPGQSTILLTELYAKMQVESGLYALKSGNVKCAAGKDGTPDKNSFTVTGLESEISYDLYYVAKDEAGNYSRTVKKITFSTLDENPPKILGQHFSKYNGDNDTERPTRDTDITIEFSENVKSTASGESFLDLYETYISAVGDAKETSKSRLVSALRTSLTFYKEDPDIGTVEVDVAGDEGVDSSNKDTEWIDYSQVEIHMQDRKLYITFLNDGLSLKAGSVYYFEATKISDITGNEINPRKINYNTPASSGHSLPQIPIEFAQVELRDMGGVGDKGPYAVKRDSTGKLVDADDKPLAAGDSPVISTDLADVHMSFNVTPKATITASDIYCYDILLFFNKRLQFDLYYRIVDENGTAKTAQYYNSAATAPEHAYLLPTQDGYGAPDQNEWIYLGDSGKVTTTQGQWAGKSVNADFGGCNDRKFFPKLKNLPAGHRYEFAVSVRSLLGNSNPDSWSEPVSMRVYAAAGQSGNLNSLHSGDVGTGGGYVSFSKWEEFSQKTDALTTGAKSIGERKPPLAEEPDFVQIPWNPDSTKLPTFRSTFPSFEPDITGTKVSLRIPLTDKGWVYYVVGRADINGVENHNDYNSWQPDITTNKIKEEDGKPVKGDMIVYTDVPQNGLDAQKKYPNSNYPTNAALKIFEEDDGLNAENILDPTVWINNTEAIADSFHFEGVATSGKDVEGLLPDTTYYIYLVITGEDQGLSGIMSDIHMFTFKTNPAPKPVISYSPVKMGVSTSTHIASQLNYVVYPLNALHPERITLLTKEIKLYTEINKILPDVYDNYTIYDALKTPYNSTLAKTSTNSSTAYYPPEGTKVDWSKYSIFDIYASRSVKKIIGDWIRSGNLTGDQLGGTHGIGWTEVTPGKFLTTMPDTPIPALKEIKDGNQYFILTVAKSVDADGDDADFDSFAAYDPVQINNPEPPNVIGILGNMTVNSAGLYSGSVTLLYDQVLFNLNGEAVTDTTFFLNKNKYYTVEVSGREAGATSVRLSFTNVTGSQLEFVIMQGSHQNLGTTQTNRNLLFEYAPATATNSASLTVSWRTPAGQNIQTKTLYAESSSASDRFIQVEGVDPGTTFGNYTITLENTSVHDLKSQMMNPDGSYFVTWSYSSDADKSVFTLGSETTTTSTDGSSSNTVQAVGFGEGYVNIKYVDSSGQPTEQRVKVIVPGTLAVVTKTTADSGADGTSVASKQYDLQSASNGNYTLAWERVGNPSGNLNVTVTPSATYTYSWSSDNAAVQVISGGTSDSVTIKAMSGTTDRPATATITLTVSNGAKNVLTKKIVVTVTGGDISSANFNPIKPKAN